MTIVWVIEGAICYVEMVGMAIQTTDYSGMEFSYMD